MHLMLLALAGIEPTPEDYARAGITQPAGRAAFAAAMAKAAAAEAAGASAEATA